MAIEDDFPFTSAPEGPHLQEEAAAAAGVPDARRVTHRDWVTIPVFALSTLAAAVFFYQSAPKKIAFGPWLGPMLESSSYYASPWLSHWCVQRLLALEQLEPALAATSVSIISGALVCGAVAAVISLVLFGHFRGLVRAAAALSGAVVLAVTAPLAFASTGAGPAATTAAAALLSLAAMAKALPLDRRGGLLLVVGLLAGLAAANHPSFLLLLPLYGLMLVLFGNSLPGTISQCGVLVVSFLVTWSTPIFQALRQNQDWNTLFSQALATPYPTLGDGTVNTAFAVDFLKILPLGVCLLALPGLIFLFGRKGGSTALLLVALVLVFGPLLPLLTNMSNPQGELLDADAASIVVTACVLVLVAAGVAALPALLPGSRGGALTAVGQVLCLATATVGSVYLMLPALPHREGAWAEATARALLEGVPPETVMVTGDRRVYSLLRAAQLSLGLRGDVMVVPGERLHVTEKRKKLARLLPAPLSLNVSFPTPKSLERWKHQLPFRFERLANAQEEPERYELLHSFALWDFVSENVAEFPLAFAGVEADWLASRATAVGPVLYYPAQPAAVETPFPPLYRSGQAPVDPEARPTLSLLLQPLAQRALHQGEADLALELAQVLCEYQPDKPMPFLLALQAQARLGQQEAVSEAAGEFLERWFLTYSNEEISIMVVEFLERHSEEQRLRYYLEQPLGDAPESAQRHEYFDPLWKREEFRLLQRGYEQILTRYPFDIDALYQLSAVSAQLGEYSKAEKALQLWRQASGAPVSEVLGRVRHDGRFAHFQMHQRMGFLSGTHSS